MAELTEIDGSVLEGVSVPKVTLFKSYRKTKAYVHFAGGPDTPVSGGFECTVEETS